MALNLRHFTKHWKMIFPLTLARLTVPPFRTGRSFSIAVSPDSTRVYISLGTPFTPADHLGGYRSRDYGDLPGSPAKVRSYISRIAVTPDNKRIYVAGNSGVWVYDAAGMKPVQSPTLAIRSFQVGRKVMTT